MMYTQAKGNILIIVLMIVGALYLLASMMFVINQQYFSDMLMSKNSANHRQTLLSVGLDNIQTTSQKYLIDGNIEEWQECDVLEFPNMSKLDDVFLKKARLANYCHDGDLAHRVWLASLDNLGDHLVIDQLITREDWQSQIDNEQDFVDILDSDNAWRLILNNGELHQEIVLIEAGDLPKLVDQAMRIHNLHYEIVLVFEDSVHQQVMLYHLWIPMADLHFDISMIFQFSVSQYLADDHNDIVMMSSNDARNPNWQMAIDQKQFDAMWIKNNVIFATLYSQDQTHKSIIGMYLRGSPLFGEQLIGFEYKSNDDVIELIPCLYRLPLILAGQWKIGCDVQQKIRYYFSG